MTSFRIGGAAAALILAITSAHAQPSNGSGNGFTTVNAPGGGQYIYGPFTGKGSMSDAVLYMLRNIHQYFGNRPELGKFVQSRDGTQTAAFFGVNAKGAAEKPMTGLFIVARTAQLVGGTIAFGETHLFVGEGYLVSVRHGASTSYTPVRERCESCPRALARGEDYILYAILDFIVDNYCRWSKPSKRKSRRWRRRCWPAR